MDDVEAREVIRRALGTVAPDLVLDGIGPEQDLRDGLDLDSLDLLTLFECLTDLTGVEFPEVEQGRVGTLAQLSSYLVAGGPTAIRSA